MTNASATPSRDPRRPRGPQPADDPAALSPIAAGHRPRIALALQALAVPIETVTLHPNNPRVGDVEAVAASLKRFGQMRPILIQASTRYVVAGNHLLRAARSLGWTELAVVVVDIDDATAYLLADNRTSDLGGYDERLLAAILAEAAAADNLAATAEPERSLRLEAAGRTGWHAASLGRWTPVLERPLGVGPKMSGGGERHAPPR